jgi:hypothetical protein
MRVGLLHLGQSVDFVGSISFLRSPVFAILAIGGVFLLLGLSLHTPAQAGGFNGAVLGSLVRDLARKGKCAGNKIALYGKRTAKQDSLVSVYISPAA